MALANVGHAQSTSLFIDIANPANGKTYPGPTDIELIAGLLRTNDAALNVEFIDGLLSIGVVSNGVVVDPPGSPGLPPGSLAYIVDWTNQSPGFHELTALATDTNGNTFHSALVTIFIGTNANPPPGVLITQPTNNEIFTAPANSTSQFMTQRRPSTWSVLWQSRLDPVPCRVS